MTRKTKLVRDSIPDMLTEEMKAKNPVFRVASPSEFRRYILEKVVEEALELQKTYNPEDDSSDDSKMVEELADLDCALTHVLEAFGVEYDEVMTADAEKTLERGDFSQGVLMEYDE